MPCKVLEHGTSPAVPFPASSPALGGGCLGMDDSPARVPCATWSCPSRNKAPYLFTRGPGSVATAASSFPSSPGVGTSPHASPRLSSCPAAGFLALLWHTRASRCSLPKVDGWCWDTARSWVTPSKAASAASSLHQGFTSSEGRAPRWLQRLSPGSIGSLGVLDGCGSQSRALCRSRGPAQQQCYEWTPKTHLWAVGPLGAVTMLPSMGRCPALSSAPVQSDTGWEVGTP